jgi:hypothetical protein
MRRRRLWGGRFLVLALLVSSAAVLTHVQPPAPTPDEPDPVLTADALVDPAQLTGPHHRIEPAVRTPGPYHVFTVTSTFGTFEAVGRRQLAVRLQEIAALAALDDVNRAGVVARAAGEQLVKVGTGVVSAVSDPVDTAKGIGSGVKRLGVNLARRTKRAYERVTDDDRKKDDDGNAGDAAADAGKRLIGVNAARRKWAQRVNADPYTSNPVLREALETIAGYDVAGRIATGFVVPIPPLVSTTAKVGDLVWGRDPEALRKLNEARARELRATDDGFGAFFRNRHFTLTMQTRLVAALHAVRVPGLGDYLESAAEAEDEREALFFVESAEMLQMRHAETPVSAVLPESRALVARLAGGGAVALLPLDWVRRSDATTAEFKDLAARARPALGATTLRLEVSGTVTPAAAQALAGVGWTR